MLKLIKYFDKFIVPLLLMLLYPKKFFLKKTNSNKILIIKLWAVGESILTLPSIKRLNEKGFSVDILCTTNNLNVFSDLEYINNIYLFEYKNLKKLFKTYFKMIKINYKFIYDFEPFMNISSLLGIALKKELFIGFSNGFRKLFYNNKIKYNDKIHCSKVYIDIINEKDYHTKLEKLSYKEKDKNKVDKILSDIKNREEKLLVGIHIGTAATGLGRRWDENKFAMLHNKIIKNHKNVEIFYTGTNFENELFKKIEKDLNGNYINFISKLNLKELFYLLEISDVFICGDTGPLHIAAAMQKKVIGLFGANLPDRFRPYGEGNVSIYHKEECSPCINVHKGKVNECFRNFECMKKISVEEVYKCFTKALEE